MCSALFHLHHTWSRGELKSTCRFAREVVQSSANVTYLSIVVGILLHFSLAQPYLPCTSVGSEAKQLGTVITILIGRESRSFSIIGLSETQDGTVAEV